MRNVLYMAARSAINSNPAIRRLYQRLTAAGKVYKVAFTACMRKLLTLLNHLRKTGQSWQPSIAANP